MSDPLLQTHDTLQKCLANAGSSNDFPASLWEEIQSFKPRFLQMAASASSVEALRILVEITALGCTDAMNSLSHLQQQGNENTALQSALSRLELSLSDILFWLRAKFGSYFNQYMALPHSLAVKELANARCILSAIPKAAGIAACGEWLTIISNLVNQVSEAGSNCPSYQSVSCIQSLLTGIREISAVTGGNTTALNACAKLLIRLNCNEPSVIHFIFQGLSGEANDILSLSSRIEKWQWFKKEIGQLVEGSEVLYPGIGSVKASLLSAINAELAWLEQKDSTLSAVYGNRVSSATNSSAVTPLLTTLSVSQLAVWCRLLSGCGILKNDNQSELLKMIAGAVQTTRATNISPDSLRAKYYSPDRAALAVVKEHLFRMISLVKDM